MFSIQGLYEYFFPANISRTGNKLPSASNDEGAVTIDVNEIAECCIHKVPINLRKVKEEAYNPQLIAIGPYHHGKKQLADMEKHKRRYKQEFDERITMDKREELRKQLKKFVKNNEKRIRRHYSEPCGLSSSKFVKMIIFDAIFIIELFLRCNLRDRSDFLLEQIWLGAIRRDLQLFENQLPYFVLEELYKLAFPSDTPCPSCGASVQKVENSENEFFPPFRYLSCVFFLLHLSHNKPPLDEAIKVKHFTDLCRHALVRTQSTRKLGAINNLKELPNAVKLRKSGVKFKGLLDSNNYLVEINVEKRKRGTSFSNEVDQQQMPRRSFFNEVVRKIPQVSFFKEVELQIPRIYVNDGTESLIRNVMALEQCHYPSDAYICGYIELMDFLIENEEDVDYLVKKEIISNHVSSNAVVVEMFNKLCREIPSSISYYYDICKDLRDHYDSGWNHTVANLKSTYFSNLWRSTATVVAFIILMLTLAQTVFSIWQVFVG